VKSYSIRCRIWTTHCLIRKCVVLIREYARPYTVGFHAVRRFNLRKLFKMWNMFFTNRIRILFQPVMLEYICISFVQSNNLFRVSKITLEQSPVGVISLTLNRFCRLGIHIYFCYCFKMAVYLFYDVLSS